MGFINNRRPQEVRSGDNLRHVKDVVQDLLLNSTIQQVERIAGFGPKISPAVPHHTKVELERSPVSFLFDFLNDRDRQGYLVRAEGLEAAGRNGQRELIEHFVRDTAHLSNALDSIPDLYEAMVKMLLQIQKDEHKDDSSDDYVFDIVERLELAQTLPNGKRVVQVVTVSRPAVLSANGDIDDSEDNEPSSSGNMPFNQDDPTNDSSPTEGDAAATASMEDTSNDNTGNDDVEQPKDHPEEGNDTMSIKEATEKLKNTVKEGVDNLKNDENDQDTGTDQELRDQNDVTTESDVTTRTFDHDSEYSDTDTSTGAVGLDDSSELDGDVKSTRVYNTGGAPLNDEADAVVPPGEDLNGPGLRDTTPVNVDAPPGTSEAPVPDPLSSSSIEDPDRDLVDSPGSTGPVPNTGDLGTPYPGDDSDGIGSTFDSDSESRVDSVHVGDEPPAHVRSTTDL